MTEAAETRTTPRRGWVLSQAERLVESVDQRARSSRWLRRNAGRVSPDHWSFWLGHLALFSFVVIVLSGLLLVLWFKPSMAPVTYDGAYEPLGGVVVSEAYASTLDISFEVRGGLLVRQVHYWATHVFVAAMAVHLLRVFFTGAFRTPRKGNWLIGLGLLVLGVVGGYTGHALPDDLLSGTGLRVVEGGILAIPIVGTYLSSAIFGGEYPGDDIVSRLYLLHVFLVPALIVALLAAHLVLVRRQGHTRWGGAGKTGRSSVGSPFAVHIARAGAYLLMVFGVVLVMAGTLQINPVWLRGPYDPAHVGAGSQPDWYIAFLDGALRLMPPWQIDVFGHEVTLSVVIPAMVLPGIMITALAIYPWIEQKVTGAEGDGHILERPRNMPTRTGLGVGFIVFFVLLWIAGGNDVIATAVDVPVNWVTRFLQVSVIVMPPLAYSVTKRICLGLQRRDRDTLVHGRDTGVTVVSRDGRFSGVHRPLNRHEAYALTSYEHRVPFEPGPETDENGIPAPRQRGAKVRAWLSKVYFVDVIDQPTAAGIGASAGDAGQSDATGQSGGRMEGS
ncbi:MAG TPA: cytochrome bc complex cytochrome b subunit [Jiangellaceae bacterium]